ncbi:MAG: serine hydroxymethyltransferase [Christensenellaceae bacterium]|jgi:glycine hydroxymethyltransferase|nr:serine hydroxymethyltransferase [Christensenellaceae bacterium]
MGKIENLIKEENKRQWQKINLIASENIASKAIMRAMGSCLTNKYAEGYPSARYYSGCETVDKVENYCRELACKVFEVEHANVQPHCGSSANMAVYFATIKPGDTILSMSLDAGGHLTHGAAVSFSGKLYNIVNYGLDKDGILDYAGIEKLAKEHKPKIILAGGSAYSLVIDFERIAKVAESCGAIFMVDMAHFAGLVAAGLHPNPCKYADIVTTTTHKTLRGPRGGMILCKEKYAKAIDKAIFPGCQGGPLMHVIAAKAVCLEETLTPEYKTYIDKVMKNTNYLCEKLKQEGIKIISGKTETHLFLIDLRETKKSGREVQDELEQKFGIVTNKNKIQDDPRTATETSGIRVGLAFITNLKKVDHNVLDEIKDCIVSVIMDKPAPVLKYIPKVFR